MKTMKKIGLALALAVLMTGATYAEEFFDHENCTDCSEEKLAHLNAVRKDNLPKVEALLESNDKKASDIHDAGYDYLKSNNYVEALQLFLKAAKLGFAPSQLSLGIMYMDGRGIGKNFLEARKWLLKAADQGTDVKDLLGTLDWYESEARVLVKEYVLRDRGLSRELSIKRSEIWGRGGFAWDIFPEYERFLDSYLTDSDKRQVEIEIQNKQAFGQIHELLNNAAKKKE